MPKETAAKLCNLPTAAGKGNRHAPNIQHDTTIFHKSALHLGNALAIFSIPTNAQPRVDILKIYSAAFFPFADLSSEHPKGRHGVDVDKLVHRPDCRFCSVVRPAAPVRLKQLGVRHRVYHDIDFVGVFAQQRL